MTDTTTARRPIPKKPFTSLATRIPDARTVCVTGDFTQWSKGGLPLEKEPTGEWVIHLKLAPGEYQYRLLVDGQWQNPPEVSRRVTNPYGSENCVLEVR